MKPARARALILRFFGTAAGTMFDPDWPETMLQLSPGATREQVISALRAKLERIEAHPDAQTPDGQDLAAALRSVAAQMVAGPGATWSDDLAALVEELPAPLPASVVVIPTPQPGVETSIIWPEPVAPEQLLEQARAIIATTPNLASAIARVRMLASAEGLDEAAAARVIRHVAGVEDETSSLPPAGQAQSSQPSTPEPAINASLTLPPAPLVVVAGTSSPLDQPRDNTLLWWVGGAIVSIGAVVISGTLLSYAARPRTPAAATQPVSTTSSSAGDSAPGSSPTRSGPQISPSSNASPSAPGTTPQPPRQPTSTAGVPSPARVELPNPQLLLKDLRDASAAISRQPQTPEGVRQAIDQLAGSINVLCQWWPRLDEPTRRAAAESVVESAFKCATDAEAEPLIAALTPTKLVAPTAAQGAARLSLEGIWPESARAGLLARLLRERELPSPVLRRVETTLQAALGSTRPNATFEAGAEAALRLMPLRLVAGDAPLGPVERQNAARTATLAAERWLVAAAAVSAARPGEEGRRAAELMTLDAIESVLINGPELSDHPAAFNFVQGLLAKMRYRETDPSRPRVVAWLADERISIGDASSIMQALAALGTSSGVDATMTFPLGATPLDRDNARAALAAAWALSTPAAGPGLAADWLTAARAALNVASTATIDAEQFTATATLARIARAAAHRQRAEALPPGLLDVDLQPRATGTAGASSDPKLFSRESADDGVWAIRYLVESKTNPARIARLEELGGVNEIGPVDAGVLAEAALGASVEVRAAAQSAALRYAHRPAMINAVLDAFPRAARSARNVQFLAQMAGVGLLSHTSPAYGQHYRRGLVERLLYETAGQSPALAIDEAASLIAEANFGAVGLPLPNTATNRPGLLAAQSAQTLARALRDEVAQLLPGPAPLITPAEIDQRQRGRLLISAGLVQRFIAHQAAAAECLAVLAARERPARAEEVGSLLTSLGQARARARSAGEQARLTQEVIVRLWAIRLGEQL